MTDFNKILDKARELESKMKESQENIKKIRAEGSSGSNSVKVILDGEGEMQQIIISDELLKEEKSIVEDLIVAAHNNAKSKLKTKTNTKNLSIDPVYNVMSLESINVNTELGRSITIAKFMGGQSDGTNLNHITNSDDRFQLARNLTIQAQAFATVYDDNRWNG